MFIDHEIKEVLDGWFKTLARDLAQDLDGRIRAIVKQELKPMVDAVKDLSDEVTLVLADIGLLATAVQTDTALLAKLASEPPSEDNSAAIAAQTARLKTGTDGIAALIASISTPVTTGTASPSSPAPVSPAPVAASPAPAAAGPTEAGPAPLGDVSNGPSQTA